MPKLFIFTGPSGVGKSYVMEQLQSRFVDAFVTPKMLTTRQPRPGEVALDRQFISANTFKTMLAENKFMFADQFNGHWYGCTLADVTPVNKHVLVNAWPAMLDIFGELEGAVIIGMTVSQQGIGLLEERIKDRDETPEAFAGRMERIKVDLADLAAYTSLISQKGRLFTITGDSEAETIITWIQKEYL